MERLPDGLDLGQMFLRAQEQVVGHLPDEVAQGYVVGAYGPDDRAAREARRLDRAFELGQEAAESGAGPVDYCALEGQ